MDLLTSLILGIVEGLTEFIPVSSTGHLILVGDWLGFKGELASTFEIFIQLGAILAVVLLYWKRFTGLIPSPTRTGEFEGFKGIVKVGVACLPAFILGFLLHKTIKENLFSPMTVSWALLVGGIIMFLIDRDQKESTVNWIEGISVKQALIIGICQCFALWPGMSRSASTIVGGLLCGLNRKVAAEFSFIVAVPVMFAATGYDLLKSYSEIQTSQISFFAVGFITAFISAVFAIRLFISLLGRITLRPFAIYRILIGAVMLVLVGT